ncbi:anti-sigma factor [Kitasatospora kazusensis]|uniref:Regulator of SigK n=1 Tax=Kitasatospora kazusensis TaxID=407974 RepID=A0ABP5LSJ7_9ACTN
MTVADLHTLTGAYATHSLSEQERQDFERHLAACPACTLEVQEFSAALARLGSAEALVVPAELKSRVMAGISSVRQLAPGVAEEATTTAPGRGRLRRYLPRLALAASVAVAALLGGVAVQQHGQADRARATASRLASQQAAFSSLLTAPDARTTTGSAGSGVGTVVYSQSRGEAGFLASNLPTLPSDRTYQLWYNDHGTMRPAGLLPASNGSLLLTGRIDGAAGIGVTVEPAGGSRTPSAAPMMLLSFA